MKPHLKPLAIIFLVSFVFEVLFSPIAQDFNDGWFNHLVVASIWACFLFVLFAIQYFILNKKQFLAVYAISLLFCITGAILDDDLKTFQEYMVSYMLLIYEIIMMTFIVSTFIAIGVGIFNFLKSLKMLQRN